MIWACSPEFFEHRRQLRRLKPRPAGRLANAWHSFVNLTCYCILNDASTNNVDQVPDEAAVIPYNQPSVATTRNILMAEQASNSSGLLESTSSRKRRSSSFLSPPLPKSSVAPLEVSSLSPSLLTPSPSSVSPSSSSYRLFTKKDSGHETVSTSASCSTSTQDKVIEKVTSGFNIVEPDMHMNIGCNDHIRAVPGSTIPDVDRLIKRTLDWGMSSPSTSTPSSSVLRSSPGSTSVMDETKPAVSIEVLLGLKKPKNEYEAMAQQKELGNEAPYWMQDESHDKESGSSRDIKESRDGGVDSGMASRNTSTNN